MQDQLPRVPRGPEPACPQRVLAQRQTAADFIGAPAAPWEAALGQRPQSALGQHIRQISGAWEQPGRGRHKLLDLRGERMLRVGCAPVHAAKSLRRSDADARSGSNMPRLANSVESALRSLAWLSTIEGPSTG